MAEKQRTLPRGLRLMAVLSMLAMLLPAAACGKDEADTAGSTTGLSAESTAAPESSAPVTPTGTEAAPATTLTVSNATAKAGDKQVEVTVDISNNPGIFGMDFDLYYDDNAMTLADARTDLEASGATYTPPSYFRNPTTFLWDFQDANWETDGVVLTLVFDISQTAAPGEYEVKIMYSYGNIFDSDGTPIDVKVKNAFVTVEE